MKAPPNASSTPRYYLDSAHETATGYAICYCLTSDFERERTPPRWLDEEIKTSTLIDFIEANELNTIEYDDRYQEAVTGTCSHKTHKKNAYTYLIEEADETIKAYLAAL